VDASFKDVWGERLGEVVTLTFTTPPSQASVNVVAGRSSNNLVFIPSAASEIVLQATNITTLTMEIAPITLDDLKTLLHPDNYDYRQVFLPDNREVSIHELNLTKNENEVVKVPLSYQDRPLESGIYFLQVSSPEITDEWALYSNKFYLIVSENNLVMKTSMAQAFVWASELSDYAPLIGMPVSIFTTEGTLLASGSTDQEGTFTGDLIEFDEPYATIFAVLGEPGQSNFGFSISSWDQERALYEMGINLNVFQPQSEAYIYTDRPVYRPGDTVYFKAVVFSRDNGQPTHSDFEEVTVSVYGDPGLSGVVPELYTEELTLSPYGTVDGEVVLPQEGPIGLYYIELRKGETIIETLYFDVAAYRKPSIELEVFMQQPEIIRGEELVAEVQADYYFGLPAGEQTLTWNLFQDDEYFDLPGYHVGPLNMDWLAPRMLDYSLFGDLITSGEGETDAQGHFTLTIPAEALDFETMSKGETFEYTLETTIVDESGFRVSQRNAVLIHPENFYIGIQADAYFGRVDTPFTFTLFSVDWDKQPTDNIEIDAIFEKIVWNVEETGDPTMPYRYVPETTLIGSTSPITGLDGKAKISFTPTEPGTYQITLEAGNALTQTIVWVSGVSRAVWPQETQNQITLTADSKNYQPGQIAQVFIPNPFEEGAKALITIERGRVMDSQVIDLQGDGYTISIPISAESIPNIYLSVMLFGKNESDQPDFRQGILSLSVAPISRKLNIELTLDPNQTQPRDTVSAILRITDQQGNPIQGEFSIAVVDEAVLALKESHVPTILEAFYSERPLSVQTSFSLKTYASQLTLSAMDIGGQGGGGDLTYVETPREAFPDTALWEAKVVTDSDGTASMEISLPDSLTTWNVSVRGLTEAYLVGETQGEIITQKDLMVQPVTPRFLVDGDIVELAAVVYNNTDQDLVVQVSLKSAGFKLNQGSSQTQSLRLEAGRSHSVTWWGEVTGVDVLDLVFEASSGNLVDASRPVWGDLEVVRYVVPQTFSTAGQLTDEGQRLELVSLPITTKPEFGELKVELNPSLVSVLIESLKALEKKPFDDTVSKLSRFLANLETYLALRNLGIDLPQLESELEALIKTGIRQLLAIQNVDGGWTWRERFNYDESPSDPFITAYVLLGLQRADEVGFDIEEYVISHGVESLWNQLTDTTQLDSTWQLDQLAFQVYVLRQRGIDLDLFIDGLYERRVELDPWALALLSLSIEEIDGHTTRVNTLMADLESRAVRSATSVYWEREGESGFLPGTPIFNTAAALYALSQLDPASSSVPLTLQWIMKQRDAEHIWMSTFDSAWTLLAISSALQGTGDYQADFNFRVTLNDRQIAEGTTQGTDAPTETIASAVLQSLYPNAPNALLIERGEGMGTLYYRADLNTYHPAAMAKAIDHGINLQRAYYHAGKACPYADACVPIESIKLDPDDPSQMISVAITVIVPHDMYHFMLEDFIPAGTEILNEEFLTSQTLIESPIPTYNPYQPFKNGWGWWYFNEPQIYDDHILWSADYLPAGTYTLIYTLIPFQRGAYQVLPAHAWQYFYPEVQGTTTGDLFTIN
ncbi:MAG: alpha-2-macroglobulin family protein, partial [Anaerolineales bacterium]